MSRTVMARLFLACHLLLTLAKLKIADYHSSFEGDPDVFLVGVQKAGTTSLTDLFVEELSLYVVAVPGAETHFFSFHYNDEEFNKYIEGFNAHREEVGNRKSFDGSTTYFPHPIAFQRIKSLYSPESLRRKKFIIALREPTCREYSWFAHYYGECRKRHIAFCPHPGGPEFHDTFHDYVRRSKSRSWHHASYLENLKSILEIIPRDQVFIYNFESMVSSHGDDLINRLLYFLGESAVYRRDHLLPQSNSMNSHYEGLDPKEPIHEVLCSDIRFLNQTYTAANQGLVYFINSHPERPVSEPLFLPFTERFSEKCIDDDGTLVYL